MSTQLLVIKDNKWVWVLLTLLFMCTSGLLGYWYFRAITMNKENERIYNADLKRLTEIKTAALATAELFETEAKLLQVRADELTTALAAQKIKLDAERKKHETTAVNIMYMPADSAYRLFTERTGSER